jgi:HEAT repeat protein
VPALIQALQDPNEDVCMNAARALGSIGEDAKDAVPALIQVLQDPNEWVCKGVAKALGSIGTPEALKAVKEYESRQ